MQVLRGLDESKCDSPNTHRVAVEGKCYHVLTGRMTARNCTPDPVERTKVVEAALTQRFLKASVIRLLAGLGAPWSGRTATRCEA